MPQDSPQHEQAFVCWAPGLFRPGGWPALSRAGRDASLSRSATATANGGRREGGRVVSGERRRPRRRSYSRGIPGQSRRRRFQYGVRVSGEERAALEERAVASGVTVARLLVDAALERPLPPARAAVGAEELVAVDRAVGLLDDLIAELGRVGNNINQLAHVANISGDVTMERRLRDALAENSDAVRRVRDVADDLARSVR